MTSPGPRVHSRAQTLRCPDEYLAHCTEQETEAKRGQVSWPRQPSSPKEQRLDLNPSRAPEQAQPLHRKQSCYCLLYYYCCYCYCCYCYYYFIEAPTPTLTTTDARRKEGQTERHSAAFAPTKPELGFTERGVEQSCGMPRNRPALCAGQTPRPALGCIMHCVHMVFSCRRLSVTRLHADTHSASFWGVLCSFLAVGGPLVCRGSLTQGWPCVSF